MTKQHSGPVLSPSSRLSMFPLPWQHVTGFLFFLMLDVILLAMMVHDDKSSRRSSCRNTSIPPRDIVTVIVGFFLVIFYLYPTSSSSTEKSNTKQLHATKRFHTLFLTLSSAEVILTIVSPWLLILYDRNYAMMHETESVEMADSPSSGTSGCFGRSHQLLVPHLFFFQAQICFEFLIMGRNKRNGDRGKRNRDGSEQMFWYTCFVNSYRILPISTGIYDVLRQSTASTAGIETATAASPTNDKFLTTPGEVLLFLTFLLWAGSNIFIVYEWYPLLSSTIEKQKRQRRQQDHKVK